jgi:hypothetical protein
MDRFSYAVFLTNILALVFIGCLVFGPAQLILRRKPNLLAVLFAVPFVWYFGVIDALLFGNELKYLRS